MMDKVAVYGTLKRGESRGNVLNGDGLIEPSLITGVEMYNGPGYPFKTEGDGVVAIEIFKVPDATMKELEGIEGYPHLFNKGRVYEYTERHHIWVFTGGDRLVGEFACRDRLIGNGIWGMTTRSVGDEIRRMMEELYDIELAMPLVFSDDLPEYHEAETRVGGRR